MFPPLQIHPEEEGYGFEIEEKNKAIVVKSVSRGSHAEVTVNTNHTSCPHTVLVPLSNGCLMLWRPPSIRTLF